MNYTLAWLVLTAACLSAGPVGASEPPDAAKPLAETYAAKTDQQLTDLSARWDTLNDAERRALLTEVKLRMARNKGADGTLRIRTERRYGRIIRQRDGSVIRIETQVVRVRPVPQQPFGVGFEQRNAEAPETEAAPPVAPPVVTVKDASP